MKWTAEEDEMNRKEKTTDGRHMSRTCYHISDYFKRRRGSMITVIFKQCYGLLNFNVFLISEKFISKYCISKWTKIWTIGVVR